MILRHLVIAVCFTTLATGCAFFDDPVSDPGELIPSRVPATTTPAPTPAPQPVQPSAPAPAPQAAESLTAAQTSAGASEVAVSPSYLVVAPIDSFPRDAQNITVVHLTDRSSRRDLALCKALMNNMPAIDVQDLPPNPLTVVIWPVPNDNAGANCIEMIAEFDPIDITPDAEKRIASDAAGPFLLTRNLPTGKRMIYDISFMSNSALSSTVNQWISLMGSNPADWPEYRRAR